MAELKAIAQLGAAVLRESAHAVADINDPALQNLLADMSLTLQESNGVGLAAPQISASVRAIIVASRPTPRYPSAPLMPATVMLNPSFEVLDTSMHKDWEGCLSIPGIRALVPRYRHIGISYTDHEGRTQQHEVDDFVARIFQHEYDHLQGLVYLDRVETSRDIISEQEFLKLIAA